MSLDSALAVDDGADTALAREALRLALEVAGRFREPNAPAKAAEAARSGSGIPHTIRWQPWEVAQGDAGLAILFGALDSWAPREGWDSAAHQRLAAAVRAAEHDDPALGLFSGWSGIGLAAHLLSRDGTRYRRLLAALEELVAERVSSTLRRLGDPTATPRAVGEFDLISGLTGVGAFLLCLWPRPRAAAALHEVLGWLAGLLAAGPSAWNTPAALLYGPERERHPRGGINCGLAHGVPGPLALLALAARRGCSVSQSGRAMNTAADWLLAQRVNDDWGPNWPAWAPPPEAERAAPRPAATRTGWCYGSPGVARALWLAGDALGRPDLRQAAALAVDAACRRPARVRAVPSPTFCHGTSGLFHILGCFAQESGREAWRIAARALAREVVAQYEPRSLLGFRSIEPAGRRVDKPGLLDGAAGTALALAALPNAAEESWNRLFLLA